MMMPAVAPLSPPTLPSCALFLALLGTIVPVEVLGVVTGPLAGEEPGRSGPGSTPALPRDALAPGAARTGERMVFTTEPSVSGVAGCGLQV